MFVFKSNSQFMGNVSYNVLKKPKENPPRESLWREFCNFVALQLGHNMTVCRIELSTMHTDVVHIDQGRCHSIGT